MIGTTGTSYVDGNVFGAGRGFSGDALTAGSVGGNVEVNIAGGTMYGSIYGGGRLASVGIPFTYVTNGNYGSFIDDDPTTTDVNEGLAHGHVTVNITGGTIGNDYEEITLDTATVNHWTDPVNEWKTWKATHKVPNTEFELSEDVYRAIHTKGGNVFGGSMGRLEKLDGSINTYWWPQLGQVKSTTVNISGDNTVIKSCVYGGGELGTVRDSTTIVVGKVGTTLSKPTIYRNLYGGGYGSNIGEKTKTNESAVGYVESKVDDTPMVFRYTPIMWAGMVGQKTNINIHDGWIKRNVYGGGELASVGIINYMIEKVNGTPTAADVTDTQYKANETWKYSAITKHHDETNSFALSWPYKVAYFPGYAGDTYINVYGGRLGVSDAYNVWKDNGDIYGGSKGKAGDRYEMAFCGNVGSSHILIDYPDNSVTPENYMDSTTHNYGKYTFGCIVGAVYGGGEDGHVMGDTYVTLKKGLIGHSLYGGGSGKGKYTQTLYKIGSTTEQHDVDIYSITAGKVYGNTHVKMEKGYVRRFVYGGGNLGSVGKGNYAGAKLDDFSYYEGNGKIYNGYGEHLADDERLWTSSAEGDNAWQFLNSGKTEVEILDGQVGYIDTTDPSESMKDGLPYGSVFGGSRGESAPNIGESPRYHYSPEFFSGYVNETKVIIGDASKKNDTTYKGPKILGSVFGGGQDGHVRRDTHVIVDAGEIGMAYTTANRKKLKTIDNSVTEEQAKTIISDLDDAQWLHRGNIYGAGSGIGKYEFDFDNDKVTWTDKNGNGKMEEEEVDTTTYRNPQTGRNTHGMKEIDYSTSAGSVTRFTRVDFNGGIVHRNIYGGGSLASVGPPKIPPTRPENGEDPRAGTVAQERPGWQSLNLVNVAGTVGTPNGYTDENDNVINYNDKYGGEVYGASRGQADVDATQFATSVWTEVNLQPGARVLNNVFGGGDNGMVKHDATVNVGASLATPKSISLGSAASSQTITVTTDAVWKAKSDASWLTVSTENNTVTVTATANTSTDARTATVTISIAGQTQNITVTQAGAHGQ